MRIGFQVESVETNKEQAEQIRAAFAVQEGCIRTGVYVDANQTTFKAFGIFDGECNPLPDGCRRVLLVGADEKRAEAFALYGGTIVLSNLPTFTVTREGR